MRIYYQKEQEKPLNAEEIQQIDVSLIVPNPNQPRKVFNDDSIIKLADSIRQYGIIQPLTVRKSGYNYELVAGERRLRASKELGLKTVPCIIADINDAKSAEISIIENLLREDLNIFEQAQAIESLIDTYELTQEQVAQKLSNSQSFVANKLRLLRFSQDERDIIIKNKLTERHARSLLRIVDPVLRGKILGQIIKEGLNVADTEVLIDSIISKKERQIEVKPIAKAKAISSFYTTLSKAIDNVKSSGVEIKSRKVESDNYTEISIILHKCNENQE